MLPGIGVHELPSRSAVLEITQTSLYALLERVCSEKAYSRGGD